MGAWFWAGRSNICHKRPRYKKQKYCKKNHWINEQKQYRKSWEILSRTENLFLGNKRELYKISSLSSKYIGKREEIKKSDCNFTSDFFYKY